MIKSKYINDILDLLLEDDEAGKQLRQQMIYLADTKYEYTGVGLFVSFSHADGIHNYKLPNNQLMLPGVIIVSKDQNIEAEATLWIENGLIDNLEIWSHTGDYPTEELENYTLTQEWEGSPRRQIKVTKTNT